jgi:hypothetical protein
MATERPTARAGAGSRRKRDKKEERASRSGKPDGPFRASPGRRISRKDAKNTKKKRMQRRNLKMFLFENKMLFSWRSFFVPLCLCVKSFFS